MKPVKTIFIYLIFLLG